MLEESDLARPGKAAHEAERQDHRNGQRAGVNKSHVLGEIKPGPAPRGIPDGALRRPITFVGAHGAKQIGERELQQVDGMERARGSRRVADFRPVGARRKQHRRDDGDGGDHRGGHGGRAERLCARAHALERVMAHDPVRHGKAGHHIERQQRNLIAPKGQQSADQAGANSCPP